ncbi:phage shock protein PspC (stress-responsive transcriptional regulator) [Inhella inkyongensis]|uniref:Phage shock protein PspC (Stress-responsive transcriptional regulator) n=1 Tax=Inhella inkyongensis TaxID=392593 RepID=A0A840RZC2_9BURK|nr:PspC domain-containing protein [Inhella inkyongensis]MBB5202903.1 phage shock protein PspC (stress-responsive transcriptional regulator) [Inhella inkyongensis]
MFAEHLDRLAALHSQGKLSDEEYQRAKERVLGGEPKPAAAASGAAPLNAAINQLRRSREDRWIGGVCAGIGRITGLEAWIWRLLFTLMLLCGGTGLVAYLLMWIFVPSE